MDVKVELDHLDRLATVRKPSQALAELIWNGLDADADEIRVVLDTNVLTGIRRILVRDNGTGIPYAQAAHTFERLGGSWKKTAVKTATKRRLLHGKEGAGRFKSFALGDRVVWTTRFSDSGSVKQYSIVGDRSDLKRFTLSDMGTVGAGTATGTEVEITSVPLSPTAFVAHRIVQELAEQLALYMRDYPDVRVWYGDEGINPAIIEESVTLYDLPPVLLDDDSFDNPTLTVIEWRSRASRALVLCDERGFALAERPPAIHAPGFNFTAYLKSKLLRQKDEAHLLDLADLDPQVKALVDKAKDKLRGHFRQRLAARAGELVAKWKEEEVYPYHGAPASPIEEAERQVFDICALNVTGFLPEFEESDSKSKRLSFRLLRQALEESPEAVQRILSEVLQLPKDKQQELGQLLERTSLAAIINAARVVADRLDFLKGLELLVFDTESKQTLLERKQLHRILAHNTWIFGEQFHLTLDDEALTELLVKHKGMLGPASDAEEANAKAEPESSTPDTPTAPGQKKKKKSKKKAKPAPVVMDSGSEAIVDLMLSKLIPLPKAEEREHLVVELKRPSKKIDLGVLGQIESYAIAVANDERFKDVKAKWTFIVIANDIGEHARFKTKQFQRPEGLVVVSDDGRFSVWAYTWAQIIEGCRGRLHFFQQKLNYTADKISARKHLNEVYKTYIPDCLKDDALPGGNTTAPTAASASGEVKPEESQKPTEAPVDAQDEKPLPLSPSGSSLANGPPQLDLFKSGSDGSQAGHDS